MTGFNIEEPYFVPRTSIPLDHTIEYYVKKVLPNYDRYCREINSHRGDQTLCSKKFVFDTLPFLVNVLVQDGFYFVRDFPSHPVSHLLKVHKL